MHALGCMHLQPERRITVQGGEDPFTRMDRERQERAKKTNGKRPAAAAPASGIPATVKLTTKLDAASARGQIAKGKALKPQLKQASHLAGVSTASMGKFDSRLKGEKDGERKLPGMRKKLMPVVGTEEGAAVSKVLGKVVRYAARVSLLRVPLLTTFPVLLLPAADLALTVVTPRLDPFTSSCRCQRGLLCTRAAAAERVGVCDSAGCADRHTAPRASVPCG